MVSSRTASCHVNRFEGSPLENFEKAYCQRLSAGGYAQGTQQQYLSCVAHFAQWLQDRGVSNQALNRELIVQFTDNHLSNCMCSGKVQRHRPQVRAALNQLMPVLIDAQMFINAPIRDELTVELDSFNSYLRDQRGLAMTTRRQRCLIVGHLLRSCLDEQQRLRPLNASLLRAFISAQLERWAPSSAAVMAGALRAYLRYRSSHGDDVTRLQPVVASPACWKLSHLPEILSKEQVECVLNSFAESLPSWRRGSAVAQCVARLGLRSNEIVLLELEDIDWAEGTIQLRRCKSRRADRLPLPGVVGKAIADYLCHERPVCKSRRVFVRHVAPVEVPLQPSLVGRVIRDAYRRCGLPFTRVHIFRHSLAARVLENGGTLKEVADLLRHRSLDTSQIYAKVDLRRLSAVTMPWPRCEP